MAENEANNINKVLNICKANGESFYGLKLRKYSVESVVMSLGDKISGDVLYQSNDLPFTMQEYVEYDGVKYYLVNPPTVVREGLVKDNSGLNGMTKYSLAFYHPMYMLSNFPFTDVAVQEGEELYLAQNKTFSWIGNLFDFIAKLNKNLETTEWLVSTNITQESSAEEYNKAIELSEVLTFDKNFVSDALKTAYDSWEIPFTITSINQVIGNVQKNFLIEFGTPNQEVLDDNDQTFVFRFGQGVGLKNNSRTPRNNKIVTRIVGNGSTRNIPYGYPQVRWGGDSGLKFTYGDRVGLFTNVDITIDGVSHHLDKLISYPIYKGILGGAYVELIKHPYTRDTLMPSVYYGSIFNKVSFLNVDGSFNENYNPDAQIIDYYDAISDENYDYPHEINPNAPSTEIHQFEDIYPRLGVANIVDAYPIDAQKNGGQVVTTDDIDSFLDFLDARIQSPASQAEADALQGLYDFLDDVNTSDIPITIAYYDNNTSGDYQYNCVVQPKGGGYVGVWVVWYTSSTFNIVEKEVIENRQQATLDWDDTYDAEKDEYIQSYFKIKLPNLGFDVYACASITENMQINMRGGACIGCTFDVMVDWDDYKRNFYDANGNFAPTGSQRDYDKYPNSTSNQIEVICKKDLQTFGTLMPNQYQYPRGVDASQAHPYDGDEFVILGISLPETYITTAQIELDNAMKAYMLENNIYYFDYPLKFDEHFLVTHQNILAQIKNNSAIHFLYTNEEITLYVKQIVIKYGEGVLPQWDITLTDNIEVVLNKIGQAIDGVGKLRIEINDLQNDVDNTQNAVSSSVRSQEQIHGKTGRFYYYAGLWEGNDNESIVSDSQAPFFQYIRELPQEGGTSVYVQEFWLFNPTTSGSYSQAQMGAPSSLTSGWEQMVSDFKYLITEAIFSNFAQFGSAIISGDWMMSTNGTINGISYNNGAPYNNSPAYMWFDPAYPNQSVNTTHNVNGTTWTGYNFVPNYCVDLLTGATYQHEAYLTGSLYAQGIQTMFEDVYGDEDELFYVGLQGTSGIWNYRICDEVKIILPTNQYANYGQRVTIYNPNLAIGGSTYETIVVASQVMSDGEGGWIYAGNAGQGITLSYDDIRGVGIPKNSNNSGYTPVPINSYDPVRQIIFANGIIELMCVPTSVTGQTCEWCVLNLGTNVIELRKTII